MHVCSSAPASMRYAWFTYRRAILSAGCKDERCSPPQCNSPLAFARPWSKASTSLFALCRRSWTFYFVNLWHNWMPERWKGWPFMRQKLKLSISFLLAGVEATLVPQRNNVQAASCNVWAYRNLFRNAVWKLEPVLWLNDTEQRFFKLMDKMRTEGISIC